MGALLFRKYGQRVFPVSEGDLHSGPYKVLGAGRIQPKDTLLYVFKRLRPKDGVCIGVFPKKRDELAENAALTRQLSAA